jgi:hypothetical protein
MWKIKVDTATASDCGVWLGLRVQLDKNGPVRFLRVLAPYELLDAESRAEVIHSFNRSVDLDPEDVPLF